MLARQRLWLRRSSYVRRDPTLQTRLFLLFTIQHQCTTQCPVEGVRATNYSAFSFCHVSSISPSIVCLSRLPLMLSCISSLFPFCTEPALDFCPPDKKRIGLMASFPDSPNLPTKLLSSYQNGKFESKYDIRLQSVICCHTSLYSSYMKVSELTCLGSRRKSRRKYWVCDVGCYG